MASAVIGIEAGGGFVEEEDVGLGDDGAGETRALLHAAGEFDRPHVGELRREAHLAHRLDGAFARFVAARPCRR